MNHGLEQFVKPMWRRRGLVARLLLPLAWLFLLLQRVRRSLYRLGLLRSHKAPVTVIVVGNVTAGGAGKTPVVMELVRHLLARGLKPGVISRGYGRSTTDCREVLPSDTAEAVGDEALMVRRRCAVPVFVARQRIQAAQSLLGRYPQTNVLVSDDGLQHLALCRDIEICVFDASGVGNGWLLPSGPLREPWPRNVDLVLRPRGLAGLGGFTAARELALHALQQDGLTIALSALRGRPLIAVAGIANPDQFFAMLRAAGLNLIATVALPDHFSFDGWDLEMQEGSTLVCTEKDAPKLWRTHPGALVIPLAVELEPDFLQALERLLPACLASKLSLPTKPL